MPLRLAATIALGVLALRGAAPGAARAAEPPAAAETAAERDARMGWWREARFGLFVHWGLYAIPAGEWGERTDHGEWIMDTAQIPVEEYDKLRARFNPVRFSADEWVRIAKDAGMRYIVITSKHHDGFGLFNSKHTDHDVMSTPFARDILKELAEACAREGIRLCFYHSIMDWHHPDYLPRRPWEKRSAEGADYGRYVAFMKNQLAELLTSYGPVGVLWFDGEWDGWPHERGLDLYRYVRTLQADLIVNNRVDVGRGGMAGMTSDPRFAGDFGTPEQEIPPAGLPGVDWETCMTMNDHWGYNSRDDRWKSAEDLIRMLADVASKGGNLLLNVGPTAEGEFPRESVERLQAMGRWIRVNGESIYGTKAGPFRTQPAWGRCTQRPINDGLTRLYLHVFDWPTDSRLPVPGLLNNVRRAYLLSDVSRESIKAEWSDGGLTLALPARRSDGIDAVVVVDLIGAPDVGDPPLVSAEFETFVDGLEVSVASHQERVELHYTLDDSDPTAESPVVSGPVRISESATVRARAFRDGKPVSAIGAASFRKVRPRAVAGVTGMRPGLQYDYHEGEWDRLPDFDAMVPVRTGVAGTFSLSPRLRDERFALRFRGLLSVPRTGVYRLHVASDDGSRLWIGDDLVVDNDGLHSPFEKSAEVALAAGRHPITVAMFERTGGDLLEVMWSGPGFGKELIPVAALSHEHRPARPTPGQAVWQDSEIGMFIHFAPNTYTNREYDDLSLPLDKFNPERLDTEQWASAAEAMGATYVVFVAKHAGGFCLWQTETTDYGVNSTPWRGGKGDVLADLSISCRKRGLKLGVYVSPCDRKHQAGGGGKCATPQEQEAYDRVYRAQLTEVLSSYGEIYEVWFDGNIVVPVGDILEKFAPQAMVFQGPHATIRWAGNEEGVAPYPAWNAVGELDAGSGTSDARHGTPDGEVWLPVECDARMRDTWFWSSGNAGSLKSVDQLVDMYYRSVGHGAVLLLNHTPDTSGLIPEADVRRGAEFAAELRRRFAGSVAKCAGRGGVVELPLAKPAAIDHVFIMEDIAQGERIREYVVEGFADEAWKELSRGSSVGRKKIDRFAPVVCERLRLRVLASEGAPVIRSFAAYAAG